MREQDRDRLRPDQPDVLKIDPSHIPAKVSERLARQGVREAAEWHQFKKVKMVVGDRETGETRYVDADEVLAALAAKDAQDDEYTVRSVEALNERAERIKKAGRRA